MLQQDLLQMQEIIVASNSHLLLLWKAPGGWHDRPHSCLSAWEVLDLLLNTILLRRIVLKVEHCCPMYCHMHREQILKRQNVYLPYSQWTLLHSPRMLLHTWNHKPHCMKKGSLKCVHRPTSHPQSKIQNALKGMKISTSMHLAVLAHVGVGPCPAETYQLQQWPFRTQYQHTALFWGPSPCWKFGRQTHHHEASGMRGCHAHLSHKF